MAKFLAKISKGVYFMAKEVIPTEYLLCHPMSVMLDEGEDLGRVALLHTISQFPTRLSHLPMQWDNRTFASKGDALVGNITVVEWDDKYPHQIRVAHYIHTAAAIDAALVTNPNTLLLDPFNASNADVDTVQVRRAVYGTPL